MKKILSYFIAAITLVACSQEEVTESNIPQEREVVSMTMPQINRDNSLTRSIVRNDIALSGQFYFSWEDGDKIGVFPIATPTAGTQQTFVGSNVRNTIEDGRYVSTADFLTKDDQVAVLQSNSDYGAYYPVNESFDGSPVSIPVDYSGQVQTRNVEMGKYVDYVNADDANKQTKLNEYHASEELASRHLSAKDYQVSTATTTITGKGIHFYNKRLGAIVRLYMKAPAQICYDNLQIVNNESYFTIQTKMDVTQARFVDVPDKKSHVISLQLAEVEENGFDFKGLTNESKFYDSREYNGIPNGFMIVAYMMVAPIDLTTSSTLYLCGHDGSTKYYYRATLVPKTLEANNLYQWSTRVLDPDEPITFEPINVQQWTNGTTFTNDGGKGTETW